MERFPNETEIPSISGPKSILCKGLGAVLLAENLDSDYHGGEGLGAFLTYTSHSQSDWSHDSEGQSLRECDAQDDIEGPRRIWIGALVDRLTSEESTGARRTESFGQRTIGQRSRCSWHGAGVALGHLFPRLFFGWVGVRRLGLRSVRFNRWIDG